MEENSDSTLLKALTLGSDGDSTAAVQALRAQADSADPRVQLLTAFFLNRGPAEANQRERRERHDDDSPCFGAELYRKRNVVERCVGRLKQWQAVAVLQAFLASKSSSFSAYGFGIRLYSAVVGRSQLDGVTGVIQRSPAEGAGKGETR